METLIVLGQIPGTDIQITFFMWLQAVALVGVVLVAFRLVTVRRDQAVDAKTQRAPVHASQLHR